MLIAFSESIKGMNPEEMGETLAEMADGLDSIPFMAFDKEVVEKPKAAKTPALSMGNRLLTRIITDFNDMDNQYTFTQEDMQRLTAIVHIDDERRVPEQVMNLLESLLAKDTPPITEEAERPFSHFDYTCRSASYAPGDRVKIIHSSYHGFKIGEIVTLAKYYSEDETTSPHWKAIGATDYWWLAEDDFELVQEGGVEA